MIQVGFLFMNFGGIFKRKKLKMNNYPLISNDPLTKQANSLGINTWNELTNYIQNLPYGRNANRKNLSLVFTENKGTCSSKHAVLKKLADLNDIPDVKLILGMYRMNQLNTPKIGSELTENQLDYIPEAHCYLKVEGKPLDMTSNRSDFNRIKDSILQELEIEAEQVNEFKVQFHKKFMMEWLNQNHLKMDFDQLWKIRERCIVNLSK
jgi:hypothetical protein